MYKFLMLIMLVVLLSPLVAAQDKNKDKRRIEFFGGYSYLGTTDTEESGEPLARFNNLDGFNVAATGFITNRFGITADFSAHFRRTNDNVSGGTVRSRSNSFSYLAGPQYKFSNKTRVTPFVRALAGVSNTRFSFQAIATGAATPVSGSSLNITDFALALGGGLDVRVNKSLAIRAFQLDYNPVFVRSLPGFGLDGRRFDNLRFSIGIVFK